MHLSLVKVTIYVLPSSREVGIRDRYILNEIPVKVLVVE